MSTSLFLNENDEVRAMTFSGWMCASRLRISSESPSAKYSCSGSTLMFFSGMTAIDNSDGPRGDHLS